MELSSFEEKDEESFSRPGPKQDVELARPALCAKTRMGQRTGDAPDGAARHPSPAGVPAAGAHGRDRLAGLASEPPRPAGLGILWPAGRHPLWCSGSSSEFTDKMCGADEGEHIPRLEE